VGSNPLFYFIFSLYIESLSSFTSFKTCLRIQSGLVYLFLALLSRALGCPCLLVDAAKSRRISEESNNISNGGKSANIVPHSSASSTNSGHRSNNYKPPPKTAWEAWQLQMRQNARTFCQSHFMCAEALAVDLLAGVAFVLMLAALAIWVKLPPGGYSVCDDGSDDDVHCGEGDNADDVSINGDDTPQRQNPGIGTVLAFFPLTWGYWIMHTALWEFHPWCLGAPPPPSGQQHLKKNSNSSKNKNVKASDNSSNSCCAASASSSGSPSDVCSQTWQCFASVARKLWGPFGFGQWQRERAKVRVCSRDGMKTDFSFLLFDFILVKLLTS